MTQKNKKATPAESDRSKLVAPVSGRLLAGVALLSALGLLASSQLPADWMAVAGCIVVLTSGGLILEYAGRNEAERNPHPLYEPGRLPMDSPRLKLASVLLTLALLVIIFSLAVKPGQTVSPFPFFLAAGYLFLVLPQLLARRAIKNYDNAGGVSADSEDDGEGSARSRKSRKRRKRKHRH